MAAKILEIHPRDPQPRLIEQTVARLRDGAVIVYPTDSGYALGCQLDNTAGAERIRQIRQLGSGHHFTLVCADFAQLGQLVYLDNSAFRAIKAATPGPYTFVLPATREVPRRLANAKKKTVGVRIPDNRVASALVTALGEPLLSSTLLLPYRVDDYDTGDAVVDNYESYAPDWSVDNDAFAPLAVQTGAAGDTFAPGAVADFPAWLLAQVDVVLDAGPVHPEPTTVIDFSTSPPEVLREGAGDATRFA